ncbi:alpha/beta hydrolase [uncultured Marivita sp.]|uniref:alpha/beta hydrolase n=1 Tax=uncultured Marivita sp. TaxID=888080 RepID=UPI002633C3BB|nr:alpha/beta hydrolase [uncultured Marivita sp.]
MSEAGTPLRSSPLRADVARFLHIIGRSLPEDVAPTLANIRAHADAIRTELNRGGPVMDRQQDVMSVSGMPARLYVPEETAGTRLVVYLHGGGWTILGLDTHDRLMRELASASGLPVLALDYPLAPEHPFPRAIEAICTALAGIDLPGLSPSLPLVLAGDSAGANLALGSYLHLGAPLGIGGLLLNYPVLDADFTRPSYRRYGTAPYMLSIEKMAGFWSNYCPDPATRSDPRAAPLRADPAAIRVPVLMIVAGSDALRSENEAFRKRLSDAGQAVDWHVYDDMPHAFLEAISLLPEARHAVGVAANWLKGLKDG